MQSAVSEAAILSKGSGSWLRAGQAVWLYNPAKKVGRAPKLQCRWEGPFAVLECINDVTYRIQKSPRAKPRIVHYNRLKP